ncbi:hypothetical protein EON66_05775 [archaeon]|nr:MAG: hypothetical protein EON66_05775 [archaeon]
MSAVQGDVYGPSTPEPVLQHLVPFDRPVPLSWQTIEGTFTFLLISNVTHQSIGVAAAASSHHADGVMTITLVRDASALDMVSILLAWDESGALATHPSVEVYTCVAFRLEPAPYAGRGHISLDGEDVPYVPIQAEVHASMCRVFGPSLHHRPPPATGAAK